MHVRRAVALVAVIPLLLAGCSDEAEPTPKIPESTSSSPSPTATESETAEVESAEDFIRRWAAIEAEMENTGETSEYRELSNGCRACEELAELVEGYYAAGGYIEWAGWDILSIKPRGDGTRTYLVEVDSAPTSYTEEAGGKKMSFPGGPGQHLLTLEADGSSWIVTEKAEVSS